MYSEPCQGRRTIIIHNHTNDTSTPSDFSNYEEAEPNRKERRKINALQRRSKNVERL